VAGDNDVDLYRAAMFSEEPENPFHPGLFPLCRPVLSDLPGFRDCCRKSRDCQDRGIFPADCRNPRHLPGRRSLAEYPFRQADSAHNNAFHKIGLNPIPEDISSEHNHHYGHPEKCFTAEKKAC